MKLNPMVNPLKGIENKELRKKDINDEICRMFHQQKTYYEIRQAGFKCSNENLKKKRKNDYPKWLEKQQMLMREWKILLEKYDK